eukprot:Clim_evm40s134 gene=Clim_evmTU40s134
MSGRAMKIIMQTGKRLKKDQILQGQANKQPRFGADLPLKFVSALCIGDLRDPWTYLGKLRLEKAAQLMSEGTDALPNYRGIQVGIQYLPTEIFEGVRHQPKTVESPSSSMADHSNEQNQREGQPDPGESSSTQTNSGPPLTESVSDHFNAVLRGNGPVAIKAIEKAANDLGVQVRDMYGPLPPSEDLNKAYGCIEYTRRSAGHLHLLFFSHLLKLYHDGDASLADEMALREALKRAEAEAKVEKFVHQGQLWQRPNVDPAEMLAWIDVPENCKWIQTVISEHQRHFPASPYISFGNSSLSILGVHGVDRMATLIATLADGDHTTFDPWYMQGIREEDGYLPEELQDHDWQEFLTDLQKETPEETEQEIARLRKEHDALHNS